jgi:hypothetical protein
LKLFFKKFKADWWSKKVGAYKKRSSSTVGQKKVGWTSPTRAPNFVIFGSQAAKGVKKTRKNVQ